ncbi:unnamed protein product [Aphanomyces euteiches]|uniref:Uncharacterized protein n=1 Tax=Aphanomyces euteiches TaxID=100861 RepID=A0A6G0WWL0_9STRA|nr:hypothetical protein Ae201684_010867 [Aphanomyces euteiches]KAH9061467.1 hypothetical protein Ae201684P_020803 [Aphanomyces euteiches]KAH9132182.1 hypothetical protein AeRB84_021308 [Aphanomyces euteiches]
MASWTTRRRASTHALPVLSNQEDDAAARWKELSPWNALLWPFQIITYARLSFCLIYCIVSAVAIVVLASLALLGVLLVPTSIAWFICQLFCRCGLGGDLPRFHYPWSILHRALRTFLAWDCWLHNTMASPDAQIIIQYDGYDSSRSAQQRGPQFVTRLKRDDWTPAHCFQIVMYLTTVRLGLSVLVYLWLSLMKDVFCFVQAAFAIWFLAPQANDQQDYIWGGDVSCRAHPFGCVGSAAIELYLVVILRTLLVRTMCWCTRYFCCESVILLNAGGL